MELIDKQKLMKNEYEIRGEITAILIDSPKYGRKEALISTSDLEKVSALAGTWHVQYRKSINDFYCQMHTPWVNGKRDVILLHRFILDSLDGMQVDHMNNRTLDNGTGRYGVEMKT
ncbi:hypothetical protein [Paenibacillus naphthalenovorans]|uniref:Uncharacterized protein n=1 Tax=Paenibacillus naphthalenovorans TaxID=162209 RepID=A0A0U2W6U3_9BACL|nr:hypothetical protein [Paenibacillus naphthalenovorans]ALS22158.1 hypothetical protein IJ22_17840 [Paenibacillus naphthalenovorans]